MNDSVANSVYGRAKARRGWASRGADNVEATDPTDALKRARLYHTSPWYPVSAVENTKYINPAIVARAAAQGRTFFSVHFHRAGYIHRGCTKGAK